MSPDLGDNKDIFLTTSALLFHHCRKPLNKVRSCFSSSVAGPQGGRGPERPLRHDAVRSAQGEEEEVEEDGKEEEGRVRIERDESYETRRDRDGKSRDETRHETLPKNLSRKKSTLEKGKG